jgi:hypothetical protein
MQMFPFDLDSSQESGVVLIIDRDNAERMKRGDPITLPHEELLPVPKYPQNFSLLVTSDEESGPRYELISHADVSDVLGSYFTHRHDSKAVDGAVNPSSQRGQS